MRLWFGQLALVTPGASHSNCHTSRWCGRRLYTSCSSPSYLQASTHPHTPTHTLCTPWPQRVRTCALLGGAVAVPPSPALTLAHVRHPRHPLTMTVSNSNTMDGSTEAAVAASPAAAGTAAALPGSPTQTVTLKDGRTVSYSVCGSSAPDAHTVLFFHPIQGNRYMALVLHAAAEALNLRVVAPDRPGVGQSTFLPGRTVEQYAADVSELCEHLGVSTFSIMASSAGTMYALACTLAAETKDRIVGKPTIIAPWVPPNSRYNRAGGLLSTLATWVPVPVLHAVVGFQNNLIYKQSLNKPVTDLMTRSTPTEVAAFANDPHFQANNAAYKHMIAEWGCSRAGIVTEMELCMERSARQRLHFSYLQDLSTPVRVIAGTGDTVQVFQQVQDWAQHSQHGNVELVTVEGGTHDGLFHTHKGFALKALAADVAKGAQR